MNDYYPDGDNTSPHGVKPDGGVYQPNRTLQYAPLGYAEEPFKAESAPKVVVSSRKTQMQSGANSRAASL